MLYQYYNLALALSSVLGAILGLFSANKFLREERNRGYLTCGWCEYLWRAAAGAATVMFLVTWVFWVCDSVARVFS